MDKKKVFSWKEVSNVAFFAGIAMIVAQWANQFLHLNKWILPLVIAWPIAMGLSALAAALVSGAKRLFAIK